MSQLKQIYDAKKDPDFQDSYIDTEEWRTRELPDGTSVPYLHIHGGFRKKGVKFSEKGRIQRTFFPIPVPVSRTG